MEILGISPVIATPAAFAAAIAAAVLTSFNSVLNSSTALYVMDIHEKYFNAKPNVKVLSGWVTGVFVILALALVPLYQQQESIINTVQELYGLLSMPILSTFLVGLLFKDVEARAMIIAVVSGIVLYGVLSGALTSVLFNIDWVPFHYIHSMAITLIVCVVLALLINKIVFGRNASFIGLNPQVS